MRAKAVAAVVNTLRGCFAEMAAHKNASHTLERLFLKADLKENEAIVGELVENYRELAKSFVGVKVLKSCNVALYRTGAAQWRQAVQRKDKFIRDLAKTAN